MDAVALLHEHGFQRVIILSGEECGLDVQTLLLCIWPYEAEAYAQEGEGWIHPYYPASQKAHEAAQKAVAAMLEAGIPAAQRNEIRVKPIFARLPGFSQGKNTLSYLEGIGSRFHVQIIALDMPMEPNLHLDAEPHALHCGDCHACADACPTHAIDEEGFHRERCVRQWMLVGKSVPEDIRLATGNMFLGCDICQRACPKNPAATAVAKDVISVERVLSASKEATDEMRDLIGANIAIPNRVLTQGCILAGCSGKQAYLPLLQALKDHPSEMVVEHAAWAVKQIEKNKQEP